MDVTEKLEKLQKINEVFSPSAPIDKQALFAGRLKQIGDVLNAIGQRGQHAVLFGERGVGKTSLANVIGDICKGSVNTLRSGTVNCDPEMDFTALWHAIFRDMPITIVKDGIGFTQQSTTQQSSLDSLLSQDEEITPNDVRSVLSRLAGTIIIIDELDRLKHRKTTTLLADTIKSLSDHSVDTTLLLVGVADSVSTLISEHASIERALMQIRMPRMSKEELFEIVDKGLKAVGMVADLDAKERVARLSQGMPHYTHLLGLHSARSAISEARTNVTRQDVRIAIEEALRGAQQSTITAYHKATSSTRENLYSQVLLACALANPDELGYFSAADVREPMSAIMKKKYDIPAFSQHLNAFCETPKGSILEKRGSTRSFKFRFTNPLMQPFVIMTGWKNGLIDEEALDRAFV